MHRTYRTYSLNETAVPRQTGLLLDLWTNVLAKQESRSPYLSVPTLAQLWPCSQSYLPGETPLDAAALKRQEPTSPARKLPQRSMRYCAIGLAWCVAECMPKVPTTHGED
jgi:hypothetical protein